MNNEPPLLIPAKKKSPWWPTVLDYAVLIGLAVGCGWLTLHKLGKTDTIIANAPSGKLQSVLKP